MGISGLLPVLKSIAKEQHVSAYRGQRVAVDGYSWLHKGAYCCSRQLCEGVYTDRFVRYCMSRVEMLLQNGVQPIIVFDGGRLPVKANEEESRRRSRSENKAKALSHLAAGNTAAAEECFQRAVTVTSCMAKQFIEALKERDVAFLVAPYEADAQMAYLALQGKVHAVITEDSDLLVYGCPRILFKLDKHGQGEEILLENLVLNQGVSFVGFTHDMFMMTCIMAGCDFLPSLPNIGLKKAHQHIKKYRGFVKVCKHLKFSGTSVPAGYEESFQQTLWVFRHQRVYCPAAKALVHVQPLPPGGIGAAGVDVMSAIPEGDDARTLSFLGPMLDDALARGIATGSIDPATRMPFDLAAIYSGCTHLPRGVAQALGVSASQARPGSGAASLRSGPLSRPRSFSGPGSGTQQQSGPASGSGSGSGSGADPRAGQVAPPHLLALGAASAYHTTHGPPHQPELPSHPASGMRLKQTHTPAHRSIRLFFQPLSEPKAATGVGPSNAASPPRECDAPGKAGFDRFCRSKGDQRSQAATESQRVSTGRGLQCQGWLGSASLVKTQQPQQQAEGTAAWTGGDAPDPNDATVRQHMEVESDVLQQPAASRQPSRRSVRGDPVPQAPAHAVLSDVTNRNPASLLAAAADQQEEQLEKEEEQLSSKPCSADMGLDNMYPVSSDELQGASVRPGGLMAWDQQQQASCQGIPRAAQERRGDSSLGGQGLDYMDRLQESSACLLDCQDGDLHLLGMGARPKLARDGSRCNAMPLRAIAALSCRPSTLSQSWLSGRPGSVDLDLDADSGPSSRSRAGGPEQHPGLSSPGAAGCRVSLGLDVLPASANGTPKSQLKRRRSSSSMLQEELSGSIAHMPSFSSPVGHRHREFEAFNPQSRCHAGAARSSKLRPREAQEPKIHTFFSQKGLGQPTSSATPAAAAPEQERGYQGRDMDTTAAVQQTLSCMQQRLAHLLHRAPASSARQPGATLGRRQYSTPQPPAAGGPFAAFAAAGRQHTPGSPECELPGLGSSVHSPKPGRSVGVLGLRPLRAAAGADLLRGNRQQPASGSTMEELSEGQRPAAAAGQEEAAGDDAGGQGGAAEGCADFHDIGHVARYAAIASRALNQVEDDLMQRFAFTAGEPWVGEAAAREQPQQRLRHASKRGPGYRSGYSEAKKPFKPPRPTKDQPGQAKSMDIKKFAFAMV